MIRWLSKSKKPKRKATRRLRIERFEDRTLLAADFALDISDGDVSVKPGESVVYAFDYANVGDRDGKAVLHATLPRRTSFEAASSDADWLCERRRIGTTECELELGDIAASERDSVPLAVRVDSDIPFYARHVSLSGSISGDTVRRDRNDRDRESTPIAHRQHDLGIALSDGDTEILPGESVRYLIEYSNAGNAVARDTIITVRLSPFSKFDDLASDGGWVCEGRICTLAAGDVLEGDGGASTLAAIVDADYSGRHILSSAMIKANSSDANIRDNFAVEGTQITPQSADLVLTLSDGDVEALPGETVTYTLAYANNSDFEATGVSLRMVIPRQTTPVTEGTDWTCEAGVCTLALPDLSSGASGSAELAVVVDPEYQASRWFRFGSPRMFATARIASDGPDANRRDNFDAVRTPVELQLPDLAIRVNASDATADGLLTYTFEYANNGDAAAANIEIAFRLPHHVTPRIDGTRWTCDDGWCRYPVGELAAGAEGTATLQVAIDVTLPMRKRGLFALARIRGEGEHGDDSNPRNNVVYVHTRLT